MKRIAILTSILALTACGGGSGGGLSATDSNARVTSMNTFVVVGGSNPTVNPNARSASPLADGGTRYDLEDVTFKTIPTSGEISRLIFHTDNSGKIVSIEYPEAEEIMAQHEGSEVPVGQLMRKGDTNVFVERTVLGEDCGDLAGKVVEIPTEYVSYADKLKLRYSDFGVLRSDVASTGIAEAQIWGIIDTPFMGGYNVKKVDDEQMNTLAQNGDIVFNGLAKGRVSYHDWDAGIDGADIALEGGLTDEEAKLIFAQDGSQTLTADFKNWAKIKAVKLADDTKQFKIIDNYTSEDSPYYIGTTPDVLDGNLSNEHSMVMETSYYGDNNAPNEAVGLVQYQHSWGNPYYVASEDRWDVENHVNVDLGFGGTRQPDNQD